MTPKPTFIFYDCNRGIVNQMAEVLNKVPKSKFIISDVETLLTKENNIDMIVSPANSFASMGGGIDAILRKTFNNIEKKVQACINEKKLAVTSYGEYFLPVGNCIIVETNDARCPYLASCPTMFLPQDIQGTDNVVKAFYGLLEQIGHKDITCAVCGLGTGVGGLTGTECANQIKKAYEKYYNVAL